VAGIPRVKAARRELRRAIRQAKRDCWNRFLQEADGNKVWTVAGYTIPRIDKMGQALTREDGTVAEGHWEREQAILQAHFPPGRDDGTRQRRADRHSGGSTRSW